MGGPPGSQVAPLPTNLPFRLISKTIGSGAYASIRKAIPDRASGPVIAVKFINKDHAFRAGRLRPKQLEIEVALHKHCSSHENIIRYLSHGQNEAWVWVALELAEGGDLFDKVEADEGVTEDLAHFYFTQLLGAIDWCHGKGVAHRDIKPENMLLDSQGNLKLADFGLATQFIEPKTGKRKVCGMVCGSPPYIAPEILAVGTVNSKRKGSGEDKLGYDPQVSDIWSCAIVLFVLLVGNTPWDSPVLEESYEFHDFVKTNGRPSDELWDQVPTEALSLLRGMLKTNTVERFTSQDVRKHLWYTRANTHLNAKGKAANPVGLATQMLENLHINFNTDPIASSQRQRPRSRKVDRHSMDVESNDRLQPPPQGWAKFSSTQPETPISDMPFEWEAPHRPTTISASQPTTANETDYTAAATTTPANVNQAAAAAMRLDFLSQTLSEDPSMSQFSATPSVPLTLTQQARHFKDIVPSHSLARFYSFMTFTQLLPMILSALHRLNIPTTPLSQAALEGKDKSVSIRVKTKDGRQQPLHGNLLVERIDLATSANHGDDVLEVRFLKAKGDPLEWRRLFKKVAVLCKDGIL
ncbi:kinase-like protein, partial [Polychaeton citri CBS 116435]